MQSGRTVRAVPVDIENKTQPVSFPPSPTPAAPKSRGSNQFFSTIRKGRAEANAEETGPPAPLTRPAER